MAERSDERDKTPRYQRPEIDWETRAYWEGAGRGELVLQRCRSCKVVQHRPRGFCVSCLADDIEHFVASGRGVVHTFTIVRQNQQPSFRHALPYVVAYVQLEEGPQLLTSLVGCDPETVAIGMPVRVDFVAVPVRKPDERPDKNPEAATDDVLGVPRFVPA